jgi:hypothetical protein
VLEKLKHPAARRIFVAACTVSAIAAGGLNYYANRNWVSEYQRICSNSAPANVKSAEEPAVLVSPSACRGWQAFLADVIPGVTVEFMSAFLIAGFFVGMLALIREKEQAVDDVSVLFDKDQRPSHIDALNKTTFWYHDGHLANWVRRYVLPNFKERARRTLASCQIKAAILDPSNLAVCVEYLNHVQGLEKDEQRITTLDDLRVELCSSIYRFVTERQPDHFEIELYLKQEINLIRNDITAVRAFWTTTGRAKPAIALENRPSSLFYQLSCRNFNIAMKRHKRIDMARATQIYLVTKDQPEADRISAVLSDIFQGNPEFADPQLAQRVVQRCQAG